MYSTAKLRTYSNRRISWRFPYINFFFASFTKNIPEKVQNYEPLLSTQQNSLDSFTHQKKRFEPGSSIHKELKNISFQRKDLENIQLFEDALHDDVHSERIIFKNKYMNDAIEEISSDYKILIHSINKKKMMHASNQSPKLTQNEKANLVARFVGLDSSRYDQK